MNRLVETLKLIRFVNCLMAVAGVWLGAYFTWHEAEYISPMLSGLAAFFVCAAGNIGNDLADIEIDRINRPDRVLVRGGLTLQYAMFLALVWNLLALICAFMVNWYVTAVVATAIGLLALYNHNLKRMPLVGNLVVALLGGLTFIAGGFAIDHSLALVLPGPLIPATLAVLLHLVREIVKDVQDIEGDKIVGVRTLPQIIGVSKSLLLALAILLVMVVLTYIPILVGWFGVYYKIITVYLVDLPLLALMIFVWGNPSPLMLKIGTAGLKVGMALGGLALLLA